MLLGIMIGLLIASVMTNIFLAKTRFDNTRIWRERAREAEDRQRAAELRAAEQIDAMLDRLGHPLLLAPATGTTPPVDPEQRKYISEYPHDDERWNDFVGEPDDNEVS